MNTCHDCGDPIPDGQWCTACLLPDHYRSRVTNRPVEHVTVTGGVL